MKKHFVIIAMLLFAAITSCAAGEFKPSQNINFIVCSSPGGGSDVFARTISSIMTSENLVDRTIIINNQTDGNGEVGRLTVATSSGRLADHTLLSMNSGDCGDMLKNTSNRVENFTLLATMAVDKQLLFVTPNGKYQSFKAVLEALEKGETIIMAGSKGSDTTTVDALIQELKVSPSQFKYIVYDSSGDAITAILGEHVDLVISKPGASLEYVEAKSLIPILALSDSRFSDVALLADAPTLSEVDSKYQDVERPIWRSVIAPGAMSPAAAAYWSDVLSKVIETEKWDEYIEKNSLLRDYRNLEDTTKYIKAFQTQYLAK